MNKKHIMFVLYLIGGIVVLFLLYFGSKIIISKNKIQNQRIDIAKIIQENNPDMIDSFKEGYFTLVREDGSTVQSKCIHYSKSKKFVFGDIFYDEYANLIGSCSEYLGPGSSGGNKGGCSSEILLNTEVEVHGSKMPKYDCISK